MTCEDDVLDKGKASISSIQCISKHHILMHKNNLITSNMWKKYKN